MTSDLHEESAPPRLAGSALGDLPPSSKLMYFVLWEYGPLRHRDLVEITGHAKGTVRRAIKRLDEAGALRKRPMVTDARGTEYTVRPLGEL